MYTRPNAEHVMQRVRFILPSWQPAPYRTTGGLEVWRNSLRALGTELSVISVCSFACKAVLAFFKFFNVLHDGSSLYLSLSSMMVEAFPTILTMGLLARYHSRSAGAAQGEPAMSDIGTSLLQ